MKLLLAIPHFSAVTGGAEAFAVAVVTGLRQRGHDVVIAAEDGTALEGVPLHLGPLALTVPAVRAREKPDLILDWGLNVPADVHRLGGGTHRGFLDLTLQTHRGLGRLWQQLRVAVSGKHRRTLARELPLITDPAARFLAVSEFVARQVRDTAPVRTEQVRVLHNGVDIGRYAPERLQPLRAENRRRLGLAETDVAFLFVAHNLGLKNFALLKRVFARLAPQLPEAKLVLLGKHRPAFRADWLVYAGTTRAPEGVYAAADGLVHPTFYDACANVVLEALAAGLPVLSSDRNGSAEIITSGRDGYVLPVLGAADEVCEAWCRTLAALGRNPGLRREIGVQARALAEAHSLERYVADFEAYLVDTLRARVAAG